MENLTSAQQPMEFLHLTEVAVQPSEVHVNTHSVVIVGIDYRFI